MRFEPDTAFAVDAPTAEPAASVDNLAALRPAAESRGGAGRTFLIVSAPFGPFGRELARALGARGARALRVIMNGGDALDWARGEALVYRGGFADWGGWLERQLALHGVTDIVTYGDSSPYAAAALEVAIRLGVRGQVLEQGYFRPDWITVEHGGVNANSRLPADPDWYRHHPTASVATDAAGVGRTAPAAVARIFAYHLAVYAAAPWFRRYRAHYSEPAYRQAIGHVLRFGWQQASRGRRRRAFQTLVASGAPLFLTLLQRPGDSQLVRHSDFLSSSAFLERVVESFARHAPPDARLVVRPHPFDPGLTPHAAVLAKAARAAGVEGRVSFVDHGKLHEVLPLVRGVVCVNSTAGLAAIEFGRPTITLGRAIYDMPGMTHQGGLDGFWTAPETPDPDLYAAFRRAVIAETQVNGGYATARGRSLAVDAVAGRLLASPAPLPRFVRPAEAACEPSRGGLTIAVPDAAAAVSR